MTTNAPCATGGSTRMTNAQRMTAALTLIDPEEGAKAYPRAAVFLIRRALEDQLNAYVRRNRPALEPCAMRTKTIWLAQHLDPVLAGRLSAVWHSLSCACHQQQYALAPTIGEILSWQDEAEHVLAAIG